MEGNITISNCVRKLRFAHSEMTQQLLATELGVTRQTIIAIESKKYTPSLELAFKIARFFGVSVEDVFSVQSGNETDADAQKLDKTLKKKVETL